MSNLFVCNFRYEERAVLSNNFPLYLSSAVRAASPSRLKEHYKKTIALTTSYILDLSRNTNNAIFLYAVDTLIAHLMHTNNEISKCIQKILVGLTVEFPHHMAWHMSRSSMQNNKRGFVSKEIFSKASNLDNDHGIDLGKYHFSFRNFSNCLNELSRYKPSKASSTTLKLSDGSTNDSDFSLRRTFPSLVRSIESLSDFKFVMPFNKLFMPSMLNLERTSSAENFTTFFSGLFIEKFKDHAQTMKSLQLPKKITCVCQDGVKRTILCKSADDLRKDRCFLNFANLFNQSFAGEIPRIDSMRRTVDDLKTDDLTEEKMIAKRRLDPLKLQTYFVCPISDSYGVIEWIPNLVPMKVLVETQYTR